MPQNQFLRNSFRGSSAGQLSSAVPARRKLLSQFILKVLFLAGIVLLHASAASAQAEKLLHLKYGTSRAEVIAVIETIEGATLESSDDTMLVYDGGTLLWYPTTSVICTFGPADGLISVKITADISDNGLYSLLRLYQEMYLGFAKDSSGRSIRSPNGAVRAGDYMIWSEPERGLFEYTFWPDRLWSARATAKVKTKARTRKRRR